MDLFTYLGRIKSKSRKVNIFPLEHRAIPGKEDRIVEAARRRFAHYGYDKVTMDEIAGDIGLGKGSLYYYFPTKEALFTTVVRQEQTEFKARVEEIIADTSCSAEALRQYADQRVEYFRNFHTLAKLTLESLALIKPAFGGLFKDFARWEKETLRAILDSGNSSGEFAVGNPGRVAEALLHVIQGLRWRRLNLAGGAPIEEPAFEELRHETRFVVDLLVTGIHHSPGYTRKPERHHS